MHTPLLLTLAAASQPCLSPRPTSFLLARLTPRVSPYRWPCLSPQPSALSPHLLTSSPPSLCLTHPQVAGFFVVESYVQRCTSGLAGPPGSGAALLWDAALGPLKAALERSLEGLGGAQAMLMVKGCVLRTCSALEAAGYQVG